MGLGKKKKKKKALPPSCCLLSLSSPFWEKGDYYLVCIATSRTYRRASACRRQRHLQKHP